MSDEDAQSARPKELEDLQDVPGLQKEAEQESWESEKNQESRLRVAIRDALHNLEVRIIRLLFWCVLLPVGVGAFALIIGLGAQFLTPWGWMTEDQLEDLLPAALAFKDAMAGAASGGIITALLFYRRLRRSNDRDL